MAIVKDGLTLRGSVGARLLQGQPGGYWCPECNQRELVEHFANKHHYSLDAIAQLGVVVNGEEADYNTIVTAGKNWLQDVLQEADAAADALRWHKSGIGTTAAVVGDTDLATGIYSRASGTMAEGSSANIYQSVVTISYTGTRSITEWGIFTTSTGGSLVSRKTRTAIAVSDGDSIQWTWNLTIG